MQLLGTSCLILVTGCLKETYSGHGGLFKTISIALIACGLIFKGLMKHSSVLKYVFCDGSGRKPLKIIPLRRLDGILFEISSFKDPHDLRPVKKTLLEQEQVMCFSSRRYLFEIPPGIIMTEYSGFMPANPYQSLHCSANP